MQAAPSVPVLVFSHLRWGFVYQRPQHLLSRIARQHPVVFVEEPVEALPGDERLEIQTGVGAGVTVVKPHTALPERGFSGAQMQRIVALLLEWQGEEHWHEHVAWLYTPMAVPALDALQPRAVVYDCMDELSAFKSAPPDLPLLERVLLQRADLVLTGGPSLYANKRGVNANLHCLPSAVDAEHYAGAGRLERGASDAARLAAKLQGHIDRPRLGFFGVIDERIDLELIDAMARDRVDWQIILVGPVVKLEGITLPKRPNLHWLGQQDYGVLPHLVRGWDVCLMPFAINEHTRFISPTKTLEYLAAGKPVVSTPVRDVVDMYSGAVSIATRPEDVVAACDRALHESPRESAARQKVAADTVARHSWNVAAHRALDLLHAVLVVPPVPLTGVRRPDAEPAVTRLT